MKAKHETQYCVICNKSFMKLLPNRSKGRSSTGLRTGNSVTCSKKCSTDNRRSIQYNKCECGNRKARSAVVCYKCYIKNLKDMKDSSSNTNANLGGRE